MRAIFKSATLLALLTATTSFGFFGNGTAEPVNPESFVGIYEHLDDTSSDVEQIVIRLDSPSSTLHIAISKAAHTGMVGTALIPAITKINLAPTITKEQVTLGCVIREQVSMSDETQVFTQISETFKPWCKVRTKFKKSEYSIQVGKRSDEIVVVTGTGNSLKRMTFRKIGMPKPLSGGQGSGAPRGYTTKP